MEVPCPVSKASCTSLGAPWAGFVRAATPQTANSRQWAKHPTIFDLIAASGSEISRKAEHSRVSAHPASSSAEPSPAEAGDKAGIPMWQNRAASPDGVVRCVS